MARYTLILSLLLAALLVSLHIFGLPHLSATLESGSRPERSIPLPDMSHGPEAIYRLHIDYRPPQAAGLMISAYGSIQKASLNGRPLSITIPKPGYRHPVWIDLQEGLKPGINELLIQTSARGLVAGPVIFNGRNGWMLSDWLGCLCMGLACSLMIIGMRHKHGDWLSGAFLTLFFYNTISQMSATGFMWHPIDMPSHLEYAMYIADHWRWPDPGSGWQFYHPPLYYSLEALIIAAARLLGSVDPVTCLRLFSLACMLGFFAVSARILRVLITGDKAYYAVLALLIFYPAGIIYALRLDGLAFFYLLTALMLLNLVNWLKAGSPRSLTLALIFLGLCLGARSNTLAFALLLPIAAVITYRCYGLKAFTLRRSEWVGCVLALILGLSINCGRTIYYHIHTDSDQPYLIGNLNMRKDSWIPLSNDPVNYLTFSISQYYAPALWPVNRDCSNCQNAWAVIIKSGLLGSDIGKAAWINPALKTILLGLWAYVLATGFMIKNLRRNMHWQLCVVGFSVPLFALVCNRWLNPFISSADFRYIYPALAAFCGMIGLAVQEQRQGQYRWLGNLVLLCCIGFVLISLLLWHYK